MKEEIPYKFWREYESMDLLDRREKIKHIVNNIDELFSMKNDKWRKHALSIGLLSYFDDLLEYARYASQKLNKKNKIKKKT